MIRTSLKTKLNDLIRTRGQIDYHSVKAMVEGGSFGRRYRMSSAERRLRNESPCVEGVGDPIKEYKWVCEPPVFEKYKVVDFQGNIIKEIKLYEKK